MNNSDKLKEVLIDVLEKMDISDEERDQMIEMTFRLGIGAAILYTNYSQDFKVLAKKLFEIKQGTISEEKFEEVIIREYPGMMATGLILADGTLSMEWELIVKDHEKNLKEGNASDVKERN